MKESQVLAQQIKDNMAELSPAERKIARPCWLTIPVLV
jgi:DNA-binding MurR/RpiR family transcriptional regulator